MNDFEVVKQAHRKRRLKMKTSTISITWCNYRLNQVGVHNNNTQHQHTETIEINQSDDKIEIETTKKWKTEQRKIDEDNGGRRC